MLDLRTRFVTHDNHRATPDHYNLIVKQYFFIVKIKIGFATGSCENDTTQRSAGVGCSKYFQHTVYGSPKRAQVK